MWYIVYFWIRFVVIVPELDLGFNSTNDSSEMCHKTSVLAK